MTPARITADNATPAGIRVLVCGGRTYADRERVYALLDGLNPQPSCIITGHAPGADKLAFDWSFTNCVDYQSYPARWDLHGKAAGPIRNKQMLTDGKPDLVIAFPGGRGTADMIRQAKAAGVEVIEVEG